MADEIEKLPQSHLYKVKTIDVPENDPWKNECLGRKEQAVKLLRILKPIIQPFVMTLTASYGMGKTTFFRCWALDLKKQGIHSVTFNAWETDFSSDAFSAFVSSVLKQLPDSDAKIQVKKKALQIGAALLRKTPALLAKAATKQIIGEDAAKGLKNLSLSEDDLAGLTESVAAEMFDRQEQIQNAVADFRSTLERVIASELNGELYILVDELDRCRPTYAVEVLERIKHIFSVKGAKFIIAIDRNQLENAIRGVYGADIDASGYVRKFVDWNHHLPDPRRGQYVNYLYDDLFNVSTTEFFRRDLKAQFSETQFRNMLNLLVDAYDLSLRDIDHYFTYLKLVAGSNNNKASEIEIYLAAFFKCIFPSEYRRIINWSGEDNFNKTSFDKPVTRLFEKFSESLEHGIHLNKANFGHSVATLIALMSKQTERESISPKVCVSVETYRLVEGFHDGVTYEWLSKLLTINHFENFPNVANGLKVIDEIVP